MQVIDQRVIESMTAMRVTGNIKARSVGWVTWCRQGGCLVADRWEGLQAQVGGKFSSLPSARLIEDIRNMCSEL